MRLLGGGVLSCCPGSRAWLLLFPVFIHVFPVLICGFTIDFLFGLLEMILIIGQLDFLILAFWALLPTS